MPTFKGDIKTSGLAIYYSWYAYFTHKGIDENMDAGGKNGWSHKPELKFTKDDKIELIKAYSIIDEIKKLIGDDKDEKKETSTNTSATA